jgi:hypothetical protein
MGYTFLDGLVIGTTIIGPLYVGVIILIVKAAKK